MVMDFGFLKGAMVKVIHDPCDHAMIWFQGDPLYVASSITHPERIGWKDYIIDCVPTAENLARVWFEELEIAINNLLHKDFIEEELSSAFDILPSELPRLTEVKVHETPNCWASYPVAPTLHPHAHTHVAKHHHRIHPLEPNSSGAIYP